VAGSDKPSTLDRIERLEKLEHERLARKAQLEQHRRAKLEGARGEPSDRLEALERYERKASFPMAVLGVVWAVAAVIAFSTHIRGPEAEILVGIVFVLWTIMVVEYIVRLILVPDRGRYLSSRRIEPFAVALPALQPLRILGMDRSSLVATELALRSLAILRHRGLFRVLLVAAGLLFIGAWLVLLAETNAPGSNIHNYGNALWWAVVTVTTVGYGTRYPVTGVGRAVAVVLMLVGIGLIGVLTATVASFFVQEHTDANKAQVKEVHEDLGGHLTAIEDRLARIETLLAGSAGAEAPTVLAERADPAGPNPSAPP